MKHFAHGYNVRLCARRASIKRWAEQQSARCKIKRRRAGKVKSHKDYRSLPAWSVDHTSVVEICRARRWRPESSAVPLLLDNVEQQLADFRSSKSAPINIAMTKRQRYPIARGLSCARGRKLPSFRAELSARPCCKSVTPNRSGFVAVIGFLPASILHASRERYSHTDIDVCHRVGNDGVHGIKTPFWRTLYFVFLL